MIVNNLLLVSLILTFHASTLIAQSFSKPIVGSDVVFKEEKSYVAVEAVTKMARIAKTPATMLTWKSCQTHV
jgi:hypothetical protein